MNKKKQNIKKNDEGNVLDKEQVKNLVKDLEYISIDEKGNKFYLLANSGKSNKKNNNVLDLINVR